MSIDIERLKTDRAYWDEVAPEGAEYWCPHFAHNKKTLGFTDGNPCDNCMPRPTRMDTTQWRGLQDGLPPVGALAKCDRYGDPVKVLFVGKKMAVVESDF